MPANRGARPWVLGSLLIRNRSLSGAASIRTEVGRIDRIVCSNVRVKSKGLAQLVGPKASSEQGCILIAR